MTQPKLPALEPPGFFDKDNGPGVAFYPKLPLVDPSNPKATLVVAHLHVQGQDHFINLKPGDVLQLTRFLVACLEHAEPALPPAIRYRVLLVALEHARREAPGGKLPIEAEVERVSVLDEVWRSMSEAEQDEYEAQRILHHSLRRPT